MALEFQVTPFHSYESKELLMNWALVALIDTRQKGCREDDSSNGICQSFWHIDG